MDKGHNWRRREILQVGFGLAAGWAVHPSVQAAPAVIRQRGSIERLRLAIIGVNNRGAANLAAVASENIVALCDVDEEWSAAARQRFPQAAFFTDYRRLFDKMQAQIDAVVISTPDHQHALPTAIALVLGKHVYCEKPLTLTVHEARLVRQLATTRRCITQMGIQIHAGDNYRRVVEWVQAGVLGPIRRVHVWNASKPVGGKRGTGGPLAKVDRDLWLGPNDNSFFEAIMNPSGWKFPWPHFHWRWWWEYGGGTLADLGCHYLDLPFWALHLTAPSRVEAQGRKTYIGDNDVPDIMQVDYYFPARGELPPVHLTWYHGVPGPDLHGKETYKGYPAGVLFVGEKGKLIADYSKHQLLPEELARSLTPPARSLPSSPGHHQEWLNSIRNGTTPSCHFGYAGPLTEAVLLGNVAYRAGKPIEWDPIKGTTGDARADTFLQRPYRKGWELPKV
ncbi:MAG: Gfo/Idh/MocA family oxidoreductase [Gemmataceae bacterium]|nr:Gfo/Idh/MocA family oxidoreductase [Gemmataceae bacterium]MDW8242059.1 Gfo/Idh/MocA family oxidoreductase [Thermogemmata sp.]